MAKTVFHIGANKTGSTTLQRALFSVSDKLVYLGEDSKDYPAQESLLKSLVNDDDLHCDIDAIKALFDSAWQQTANTKTLLFSDEDISRSRVPSQCARRLSVLDSSATVVLVIRNQLSAVPSWYASHGAYLRDVPFSHWKRYVSFDDWFTYNTQFTNYGPLHGFRYFDYLKLYADLFGRNNIEILFYEDLLQKPEHFFSQLADILGVDVVEVMAALNGTPERPGKTLREYNFHRLTGGRLFRLAEKWPLNRLLAGGRKASSVIRPDQLELIADFYAGNNRKLAEEFDLDLGKYGYPLEDENRF